MSTKSKTNLVNRSMTTTLSCLCCLAVIFLMSGSLLLERGVGAFNLDPYSVTVFRHSSSVASSQPRSNSAGNYFGFSNAFLREGDKNWLLVGAPKANVSWESNVAEPGTVYKCQLVDDTVKKNVCSEMRMDFGNGSQGVYTTFKYNQWFGASMDASSNNRYFVVCGHRQMYNRSSRMNLGGICLSRNDTYSNSSVIRSKRHGGDDTVYDPTIRQSVYGYRYMQCGISVRISTEGHVVMGSPGIRQWQGGLFVNFGNNRNCTMENVTLYDSYLGYSVTSIQLQGYGSNGNRRYLFAGGAPRYLEEGVVYVFDTQIPDEGNDVCRIAVKQEIRLPHYGSYFGFSILAEDTNGDGSQELFVGAPFQNLTLGDEGAVHYYVHNTTRNMFVEKKVLTGNRQGDARFGTAIASAGDLNFDGYNDVIIGSPFEDNGRGAIYIFNGSPNGIEDSYSQRIAALNLPELSSIKSFGHSLSSGMDIDGNKYTDVSVGAYMSDSVAIIRARPVHTVSAKIWFPESVISWQRPNCSKTSDDQRFFATLMISFYYNIPEMASRTLSNVFILVDHRNRSASLCPEGYIIFTDRQSSARPIQFIMVPCLANPTNSRCKSFLAADRHATYMRLFDRNFFLRNMYTENNSVEYKKATSFQFSKELPDDNNKFMNMSMSCLAMENYLLISEGGYLTNKQIPSGELPEEAHFSFVRESYLPCIKGLSYNLSIESDGDSVRRGYLQHPEKSGHANSFKENINFTVENVDQILNKTWTIVFPRYPKNIATPMKFKLTITGPSFRNDSRAASLSSASIDRIVFDQLEPVLSLRSKKTFTGQIGFKKECGDDDVCDPDLSVNMTLSAGVHSRGLVIGSLKKESQMKLRFYVENSGEAAYSVRLEIVRPSLLQYSRVEMEDKCNQVTGTTFETGPTDSANASSSTMQGLNCDVENQIHTNGSMAFEVLLDTANFREESDFPKDFVEFQCRVGTNGQIRNGTNSLSFTVPIRYEARLEAFTKSTKNEEAKTRATMSKESSERIEMHKHEYEIDNEGPGIMPSVTVDLFLPTDQIYNVSKIIEITVTVKDSKGEIKRVVNGTRISEDPAARPVENGTQTSTPAPRSDDSAVYSFLHKTLVREEEWIVLAPRCAPGPCSATWRYNISSINVTDKVVVSITVQFNIKKTEKLNYTTFIQVSPDKLSEDVKTWREGTVDITTKQLRVQASTILRPIPAPTSVPLWLILVGVFVGLLHIVAFVLILRKCGFFRRNQYEKMNEMKRETHLDLGPSDEAEGAEQQDMVSQYDNEMLREQMSVKSQSQYSAAGSYGNGAPGDETKRSISTVDALHAQHPGVNFAADE